MPKNESHPKNLVALPVSAPMPLAPRTGFVRLSPCQKRYEAHEGGHFQNIPEGQITAILSFWNIVQRTGRRNNRQRLRWCRSRRLRGICKGREAMISLPILLIDHARRIAIGANHRNCYLV